MIEYDGPDAREVATRLGGGRRGVKPIRGGFMALCPAHNDINPSLSVRDGDNGCVMLHCFASCGDEAVFDTVERKIGIAAYGLRPWLDEDGRAKQRNAALTVQRPRPKVSDEPDIEAIMPVPKNAAPFTGRNASLAQAKPSTIFTYRTAAGGVAAHVCRYQTDDGGKIVWPWIYGIRDGKAQWCVRAMPAPRPLYNLDLLHQEILTTPIVVHEGEKPAEASRFLFPAWLATTTPGGSSAAHLADMTPLAGRTVIIARDHDMAGDDYAASIAGLTTMAGSAATLVLQLPTNVSLIDGALAEQPRFPAPGEDVYDLWTDGWRHRHLATLVASGEPLLWRCVTDWPEEV